MRSASLCCEASAPAEPTCIRGGTKESSAADNARREAKLVKCDLMEQNRPSSFCLAQAVGRRELPDGAAPVPPTEQLLLSVAEQAQAVGGRAQNSGLVTIPTAFCLFMIRSRIRLGCSGSQRRQLCRKKTLHFFVFQRMSACSPNE